MKQEYLNFLNINIIMGENHFSLAYDFIFFFINGTEGCW